MYTIVYKDVTVNTCTCTDVFTVSTDQVGYTIVIYSTGGQGFMAIVNKPQTLRLGLFSAINCVL